MAILIKDKDIDIELEKLVVNIKTQFGIKNCSKSDALRFILKMRKQGKKTSPKWRGMF